ncbi:MAG: hypothetical protein KDA65_10315 [Planctomycetaceae bacterium]|nr:hypothetical protein [Planctomycetaceae bacterium]
MSSSNENESELSNIDFRGTDFPSDRLTIRQLRELEPDLFDQGFQREESVQPLYFFQEDHTENGIGSLLFLERLNATWAYAKAKGIDGPKDWDRETYRDELIDFYRKFKLASGIKHAEELVRDVERQGVQLAQQKGR